MKEWIATPEEIIAGKTTDVYFLRALKCLREDGLEKTRVCAEITTHSLPRNWNNFLFLGL